MGNDLSHAELQRDIGRMEGRLEGVERELHAAKEAQQEMAGELRHIASLLDQAKGGWKTVVLVAGVAGTVGAVITKLAALFGAAPLPK